MRKLLGALFNLTTLLIAMVAITAAAVIALILKPDFPEFAPQLVAVIGMAVTVAAPTLPFMDQLKRADATFAKPSSLWRVASGTLGAAGAVMTATGVLLDANLGLPGLWMSAKIGLTAALAIADLVLLLAIIENDRQAPTSPSKGGRFSLARLRPKLDKDTRRAVAAVCLTVPIFILTWGGLLYLTNPNATKGTDYLGVWGVVAATASILWLIAPVFTKAFASYEKHFFIGGALLSTLGLVLSGASLRADDYFVDWHLWFAVGFGAILAGSLIVFFAFAGPWREGAAPLRLARWAVERLNAGDKTALLRELNKAASPAPQAAVASAAVKVGS